MIANTSTAVLDAFVRETVSTKVSLISTDEWKAYRKLGFDFPHGVVRHSQDEYVHGAIHTNTIEGFWSIIKRGIMGTFHKVSRKYLPLYVNEFVITTARTKIFLVPRFVAANAAWRDLSFGIERFVLGVVAEHSQYSAYCECPLDYRVA